MKILAEKIGKIVQEIHPGISLGDFTVKEGKYIELVKLRNDLAVENGFKNYFEMQVKKIHRIPSEDLEIYIEKRDFFAKKYLPKIDNLSAYPHFLSKIPKLEMIFPDDVFTLFKTFPKMGNIRGRIDLIVNGGQSNFQYNVELDRCCVTIAITNHNQKIAMLIHELSHIADQEMRDHKIPSTYESESGAHKIELDVAKSISEEFLMADIREYLACFVRTEFEQIVFEDPSQAGPVLFGKILTKYFGTPKDKESYLYLQDEKLIMKPFSDLSVAVAMTNLLV